MPPSEANKEATFLPKSNTKWSSFHPKTAVPFQGESGAAGLAVSSIPWQEDQTSSRNTYVAPGWAKIS
jgi:hypothetical protein